MYNYLLDQNIDSKEDMQFALTELKGQKSWLRKYHSKMLQMVVHKIDTNRISLQALQKNGNRLGKMHHVKKDDYNSFTYNQSGFKIERHANTDLLGYQGLATQTRLKPLRRASRNLSRKQKDSQNWRKAKTRFQILHERIRNKRNDFLPGLSAEYSNKFDIIFLERLQTLNMVKNRHLARSIFDSEWAMFNSMLQYKAKMVIEIPSYYTSIDCGRCGNKVPRFWQYVPTDAMFVDY